MTLKTNGLDWLAKNAGSGDCFASSGISYRDADGVLHTGGTKDVVNAFVVANMVGKTTATIIAGTNYTEFKAINNGVDLAIGDVAEAADREATGGTYPKYCYTGGMVCTPGEKRCKDSNTIEQCFAGTPNYWRDVQTCGAGFVCQNGACVEEGDKPTTRPFQINIAEGVQCAPGTPTVILDTTEARAYFKASPILYVGVMGINVTNVNTGNDCFGFFVWEMRMWRGEAGETCPTGVPEFQEISRFLATKSDKKSISPILLGTNEMDMIGGSFEIPAGTHGTYTMCLSLWGNQDRDALIAELAEAGYATDVLWV